MAERQLGLDALLENMAEGFAMCEAIWDSEKRLSDYTILEMNPALQRMLGVGPEAVGTKLSDSPGDRSDWLGMKLVKSFVAQVNGELVTTGPPGAGFEIRVPLR